MTASKTVQDARRRETAFLVGLSETMIWGASGSDRAERMLRRLGIEDIVIAGEPATNDGRILYLRSDCVIDQALLEELLGHSNAILVGPENGSFVALAACASASKAQQINTFLQSDTVTLRDLSFAGYKIVNASETGDQYDPNLRKRNASIAALLRPDTSRDLEWATFMSSYKGVTDVVTKYVWPRIAFPITRMLANARVTPNQVTSIGLVLSVAAFFLFMNGMFLSGLLCAWAMALLDTVDGKLARVTLTSSKWGNVFDHGIDLVAPPLWWLAWWIGLDDHSNAWIAWSVWVVLGGHLAGKLVEQAFISTFRFKVHMWQRFDSTFRLVTARRNPNLIILTVATVAGFPQVGYLLMAAWIVICFEIHMVRYLQAVILSRNGTEVRSWLAT